VVVYSEAAAGYGELQQCAPPIYVAAGLLFATALINIWSVAFFSDMVGPAGIVSALIDLALGIGLLKGSATARTWVLVRAVVGGALWGLVALGTGDLAGFMFQEVYSVSLIVLLVGRGSLLKAVLVGIPNAAVMALAILGLALMTAGASLMGGLNPAGMMVEQAAELEARGQYDQAIEIYRQALNVPGTEDDPELQAHIYMNLGAAFMGKENFVKAIPELQASVALQDRDPHAHFLLGMSYFQVGQEDRALEELLRVRELDPAYPNLDASIKAVTEYTSGEHRY
jgi:tetratricopeptide (TPR) repeat protein